MVEGSQNEHNPFSTRFHKGAVESSADNTSVQLKIKSANEFVNDDYFVALAEDDPAKKSELFWQGIDTLDQALSLNPEDTEDLTDPDVLDYQRWSLYKCLALVELYLHDESRRQEIAPRFLEAVRNPKLSAEQQLILQGWVLEKIGNMPEFSQADRLKAFDSLAQIAKMLPDDLREVEWFTEEVEKGKQRIQKSPQPVDEDQDSIAEMLQKTGSTVPNAFTPFSAPNENIPLKQGDEIAQALKKNAGESGPAFPSLTDL